MARPPRAGGVNTSTSSPAASRILRAASTQGVVTPNMVAAKGVCHRFPCSRSGSQNHACIVSRRVIEDHAPDAVNSRNVTTEFSMKISRCADVVLHLRWRASDHEFRHAEGQGPHGRSANVVPAEPPSDSTPETWPLA